MSARINHATCSHPSTKVARAKCRRDLAKLAAAVFTVVESPIITAWNAMKSGPLELTAAPARVTFAVSRENWRDVKTMTSTIVINGETFKGKITGWSANLLEFKNDETGKRVRVPAENVDSVIA